MVVAAFWITTTFLYFTVAGVLYSSVVDDCSDELDAAFLAIIWPFSFPWKLGMKIPKYIERKAEQKKRLKAAKAKLISE